MAPASISGTVPSQTQSWPKKHFMGENRGFLDWVGFDIWVSVGEGGSADQQQQQQQQQEQEAVSAVYAATKCHRWLQLC